MALLVAGRQTRRVRSSDALEWLASVGVTPAGPGRWSENGKEYSDNDLAHEWMYGLMNDDALTLPQRVRVGLGMLDMLDDYWVAASIRMYILADAPAIATLYAGYRERLELPSPPGAMILSLWADWFEDPKTAAGAFAALLGDDVDSLTEPARRRVERVLSHSGPVPWAAKYDAYRAAADVPGLHPALFRGLLTSYLDYYGKNDPPAALALLDRLDLPPATEHLAKLRHVLTAGATNYYSTREVWEVG